MKALAGLLLLLCCVHAGATDLFAHPVTGEALVNGVLARPAARLAQAQRLSGQFEHQKHLREVPRPLISTGDFIFARELGVYWHTRKPFDSVVVLTPGGIIEKTGGSPGSSPTANDQPAVRMVANVFLALFTLDMRRLERDFDLFAVSDAGRWTLGLKPRGRAIAAVFSSATISGADDVEQVVLLDARGDRTVIDLSAIEHSSSALDSQTRALFDPAGP